MTYNKLKKFENYNEEWNDEFYDEEIDFPDYPTPEKKTGMFILQNKKTGLFLYKPNQWGNTFTDDVRKAKVYTSIGMMKKSVTHGIPQRIDGERGKWIIIEVDDIVLGDKKMLEL